MKKQQFKEPGLFFDENKGLPTREQQILFQHKLDNKKGSLPLTEKSQKLFSPYEYLHYVTKVNSSKESYINALAQLGYLESPLLVEQPLNDIMNKTGNMIKNSYSIKYVGVIDGNMGILSKRTQIQGEDSKNSIERRNYSLKTNRICSNIQEFENNKSFKSSRISREVISQPNIVHDKNRYLISNYSLPNNLKCVRKQRDPKDQEIKQKLEQYHAEKIKAITSQNIIETNLLHNSVSEMTIHRKNKNKFKMQKKQVQNYEENEEERICYAIIEKPQEKSFSSYSRMLQTIYQNKNQQKSLDIIQKQVKNNKIENNILQQQEEEKSKNNVDYQFLNQNNQNQISQYNSVPSRKTNHSNHFTENLAFTYNKEFYDRIQKIKNIGIQQ